MCPAAGSDGPPLAHPHLVLAVAVLAAVALAGCGILPYEEAQEPALPPGEEAAEQYRSLDGYEATILYEYSDRPDRRAHVVVDVDDGRSRLEWRAPESVAGNLLVYNGSTLVRYNATTNEYVRISTLGLDRFEAGAERIRTVVDSARSEGETTVEGPPAGGAPLPAVPRGEEPTDSEMTGRFEVRYEGTDTVAGREAHVIRYEPVEDREQGVLEQTVWLDTEYFFALRSTQRSRFNGTESTVTYRLSNLTIAPDTPASTFEFDPPPGATLNGSASFDLTSYETRGALADAAAMTVPDPDVPDRFDLERADHVRGETFTAVQLRYRAPGSAISVTKTDPESVSSLDEGERVSIGDQTGRYRADPQRALLVWQCEGHRYTVAGDVRKSELLSVARSVECA